MTSHQVTITSTGENYPCDGSQTLLEGIERLGRKGVPVGCRHGGCGVCKVHIQSGEWDARIMSRAHVSTQEEDAGIVLACRVFPRSDITLNVIGLMRKSIYNLKQ